MRAVALVARGCGESAAPMWTPDVPGSPALVMVCCTRVGGENEEGAESQSQDQEGFGEV